MKVLIIGSGGREHVLAWKIKQSKKVDKIFIAPGNAGTAEVGENIDIDAEDINALADFAGKEKIELTIVGPEAPLVAGIVDEFSKKGLRCFGPSKAAAEIEGSKSFTRDLLKKYKIPSAEYAVFTDAEKAKEYVKEKGAPIVVKADGLAAGKGVTVAETEEEAVKAIEEIMEDNKFGEAGAKIVLEEKLEGEEASYLVFTDGESILPMVSSQDHKPVFDEGKGPNTGGMGAYSPAPVVTKELEKQIKEEIMIPTIRAMKEEEKEFRGFLYGGLIIKNGKARVIEFNARFGDPEAQAVIPRLESDLIEILEACMNGSLKNQKIKWSNKACTCVVLASGGYPESYEKGKEISIGEKGEGQLVIHAGTKLENGKIFTNGGRVLGCVGLGESIKESIEKAYDLVEKVKFEKMHYRKDIGKKALDRGEVPTGGL